MLEKPQMASPAGQALLADVNERIAHIDVSSRFPIRVSWTAALVPATALLLAVVAVFYEPTKGEANTKPPEEIVQPPINKEQLEDKLKKFAKKEKHQKPDDPKESPKLKELDEDIDSLLAKSRDDQNQLRDRIKDAGEIENKIKKDIEKRDEKKDAVKEQLEQMDRLSKKPKKDQPDDKNGPGDELQKAVNQGDLDKAKEEMDRLGKKLKDKELNKDEQDQLQKQLKDVEDKLERLSRHQEEEEKEEERLKELSRKGEIDQEQLDRELEQLRKNSDKLDQEDKEDLEKAAEELKKAEDALKEGKEEEAAEHMEKAGEKMEKVDGSEERKQMIQRVQRIRQIKKTMSQGMPKQGQPQNGQPNGQKNGPGGAGRGSGQRPEAKDDNTGEEDVKLDGEFDRKGQKNVVGYAPNTKRKFTKKPSNEMIGEIKQASQEAPEAIERLRIPKAASDMTKGYFEKLGGQSEPKKDGKP
jgi:septal ring factor EnvC (AmiA/AmiB activator)